MLGKSKTKNNFGLIYTLKDRKYQYISRSTNKKIPNNENNNINNNKNNKDKFKILTNLIDINKHKNSNGKVKKYIPEFSQNNSLANLISHNQNSNYNNKNYNINLTSMPKNKLFVVDNNGKSNSSLFFNINEEMKINNNNILPLNKQKSKNIYQSNFGLENINNLNIQKNNIKKNYEEYINSNDNSLEEKFINNKNNNIKMIPFQKNKNNINNNKYIVQKILTNLFSSNKKKPINDNNIKNPNNINNRNNKYFINDSFNDNKISNYNSKKNNNKNYFKKEKKYTEKNKETPRLKSSISNNKKKISGLFSAKPKEKNSKLITEISSSKQKKINDNFTKRNLSINIHNYKGNNFKFQTSIDFDLNINNNNNYSDIKKVPKLNLNQIFNLKFFDKNKSNNNNNKNNLEKNLNNISIGDKNKDKIININVVSNSKNKKLFYAKENSLLKDNSKNKSNNFNDGKNLNKFSPKNIYIKGIKRSNIQRFFSYSKNKNNLNSNIQFMNNIKKINFNDSKKSTSKNTKRKEIISYDSNKKTNKISEIIFLDKKRNINNKHINISSSAKKQKAKETFGEAYVKIKKHKPKYSDINRIIEINNLKCMRYINNSEINNFKKININFSTNEANELKPNNKINNNNKHKRNNYSASHQSENNRGDKYIISKIGSLFKPKIDNDIRTSLKETNNKIKNKINYNLISLLDNKSKEKYNKEKNTKNSNKVLGIYESNKKVNEYNRKLSLDLEKINIKIIENKTKENIFQNTLTMYSIYIISKYYIICDKIGLEKISIYDKDKNLIPIEYSNTNEGINSNHLFNINKKLSLKDDFFDDAEIIPFILNYEPNLCINFYIKNIHIPNIEYIDIHNYSDINKGVSPVKEIKIFKADVLLYKGILELSKPNLIKINNVNNEKDIIMLEDLEKKKKIESLNENKKSLTYTIFKSLINENTDFTENILKLNRYNSARNTYNENYINSNENNNTNCNDNNNECNIENDNNINLNIKSKSFVQNSDLAFNKENENIENNIFFKTCQENNNLNDNLNLFPNKYKDLSNNNFSNLNLYTNELIDKEKEINFSKTLKNSNNTTSKLFLNSYNSASDDCNNLFRTSVGYRGFPDFINLSQPNEESQKNYVELNKISIYLKSNFGHKKYIGLTGIIFFDENNEKIDIEKAKAIGALPKDLRTIYNDDSDNRIFENLFNGINNTNDCDNMWVTRIKKNEIPYFELFFEEKIKLSKIIIYNYNQKDRLEIGTKEIEIYIDNYFFHKFNLIQGTGEIAYVNPDDKNNSNNDFGEEIIFTNEFINSDNIDSNKDNNSKEIIFEDLRDIKYASNLFDQCYETPYLPCGNIIKIQFISYYVDNKKNLDNNELNEFYIGIKDIQIYNAEGENILDMENKKDKEKIKYKVISNREIKHNEKSENNDNDILIKGIYDEDENGNILYDDENYLFYIFESSIQIGYIKFEQLNSSETNNDKKNNFFFKAKEIKIFCDDKIIYEGSIYNDKQTIILFTSDDKITKNINKDYLTNSFNERKVEEIQTNNYKLLILN